MEPSTPRSLMFHRLAQCYDALYAAKDYEGEAGRFAAMARRLGGSGGRSWLDVACGTGRHLEVLRRSFDVLGVDGSAEMLRIARRRLPGTRLVYGDMRTFSLGRTFDVVSCLFSAIGHLPNERDLARTYQNFATHLAPGGVLFVEPWIPPAEFRSGSIHLVTANTPELQVARMAHSARRGDHSFIHYHYLVGVPGRPIEALQEVDRGLLVDPKRHLELLTKAGLRPRYLRKGSIPGRGLLVATKPLSEPRTRA